MPNNSFALCLALLASIACDAASRHEPPAQPLANFELVCDSSNTKEVANLFCFRLDTRDGDIRRIDFDKIPRSSGATRSDPEPAGTYQLACESGDTEAESRLRCVRMNRATGTLLLVALPKVGFIPTD